MGTSVGAPPGLLAMLLREQPLGVLIVDSSHCPVFANPAAKAILEQEDGIGLVCGVLRDHAGRKFESHLQRALRVEIGPTGDLVTPFYVLRPSGRRPYEVTIRVPSTSAGGSPCSSGRHAIVYVRDPDAGVPIDEPALRMRYRLTPAEAKTAVALSLGGTLPEHSELRKLRPMTLRGYVKQIFARTGTHSQLDVVRLVLTGASSLALGSAREGDDRR